jgi:acyl carrier protein
MVSERLKRVILKELELDEFPLDDATTADQVPGWDSLSHVRVISAVEADFGVRFKTMEVLRLRSVGDLQALVDAKLK